MNLFGGVLAARRVALWWPTTRNSTMASHKFCVSYNLVLKLLYLWFYTFLRYSEGHSWAFHIGRCQYLQCWPSSDWQWAILDLSELKVPLVLLPFRNQSSMGLRTGEFPCHKIQNGTMMTAEPHNYHFCFMTWYPMIHGKTLAFENVLSYFLTPNKSITYKNLLTHNPLLPL